MSQQPETLYLNSVMQHSRKAGIHWEKTHNVYRRGTADVFASAFPRDLWIEFKYSKKLKTILLAGTVQPCLTALQLRWLLDRHKEGRRVTVCIGFPQGGCFINPDEFNRRIPLAELEQRIEVRKVLGERLRDYLRGKRDDLVLKAV
jgi:hypothetical protein